MAISVSLTNDQARLVIDALIQARTGRTRKSLQRKLAGEERSTTVDLLIVVERQIYEAFQKSLPPPPETNK